MAHEDRRRGCILGIAIGEAMGTAVEGRPAGTFPPVYEYRDARAWGVPAGQWGEATATALAVAESIAERGWDPDDQARRMWAWWREGRHAPARPISSTTRAALGRFELVQDHRRSGMRDQWATDAWPLARVGPVAAAYHHLFYTDPGTLARMAEQTTAVTHDTPDCRKAARWLVTATAALINGEGRGALTRPPLSPSPGPADRNDATQRRPCRSPNEDCREAVGAALWAFESGTDFANAVLTAVNLGGQAAIAGAICGQLAGAHFGANDIPRGWLRRLQRREEVQAIAEKLLTADRAGAPRRRAIDLT